jgi:hypothetical protein
LVKDICLDGLQKDMATNVVEVAKNGFDLKSISECKMNHGTTN